LCSNSSLCIIHVITDHSWLCDLLLPQHRPFHIRGSGPATDDDRRSQLQDPAPTPRPNSPSNDEPTFFNFLELETAFTAERREGTNRLAVRIDVALVFHNRALNAYTELIDSVRRFESGLSSVGSMVQSLLSHRAECENVRDGDIETSVGIHKLFKVSTNSVRRSCALFRALSSIESRTPELSLGAERPLTHVHQDVLQWAKEAGT